MSMAPETHIAESSPPSGCLSQEAQLECQPFPTIPCWNSVASVPHHLGGVGGDMTILPQVKETEVQEGVH